MFKSAWLHKAFRPFKGRGGLIVVGHKPIYRLAELDDGSKTRSPQGLAAQDAEPAFDLVEPRGMGRRVVKMGMGMPGLPTVVLRFVGTQIVHNDVQLAAGISGDDLIHEVQKFAPSTPRVVGRGHGAREDLQGCKQGRRSMPFVLVDQPAVSRVSVCCAGERMLPVE
jgi:hypothetical protein